MTERDPAWPAPDEPGAVERRAAAGSPIERCEQTVGDRLRRACQQMGQVPRVGVEGNGPGEDRVANRGRQIVADVVEHLDTKNGLPPVRRWIRAASNGRPPTRSAIAARLSGRSVIETASGERATSPSSDRAG